MDEVKPCACRQIPEVRAWGGGSTHYYNQAPYDKFQIECICGESSDVYEYEDDAIKAWNTRNQDGGMGNE